MESVVSDRVGFAIRGAESKDVFRLVAIYNHEVSQSQSNYESRLQTFEERSLWLDNLLVRGYPVRVAELDGEVIGFGALTPFHPLTGYRHTVTGLLYVDHQHRRTGVGSSLVEALIVEAKRRQFHSIIAGVNSANEPCLSLMARFGFERVGYFREIGRKGDKWFDDICLQLILD